MGPAEAERGGSFGPSEGDRRISVFMKIGCGFPPSTLASRRVSVRVAAFGASFGAGARPGNLVTAQTFIMPFITSSRGDGRRCRVLTPWMTVQILRLTVKASPEGAEILISLAGVFFRSDPFYGLLCFIIT